MAKLFIFSDFRPRPFRCTRGTTDYSCPKLKTFGERFGAARRRRCTAPGVQLGRFTGGGGTGRNSVRRDRSGQRMDCPAPGHGRNQSFAVGVAGLHVDLVGPRADCVLHLAGLHAALWLLGGQGPSGRAGADSAAGYLAKHSGAGLLAGIVARLERPVPAQQRRPGTGGGAYDLHRPGLEHDVQLLPFVALGAARSARWRHGLSLHLVAAIEMGRAALFHDGPGLEQHDEHGGRLVLPDDLRVVPAWATTIFAVPAWAPTCRRHTTPDGSTPWCGPCSP